MVDLSGRMDHRLRGPLRDILVTDAQSTITGGPNSQSSHGPRLQLVQL